MRLFGRTSYPRDELLAREVQVPNMLDVLELLWVEVTTNEGLAFVGALYHPPKPKYKTCLILDALETSMEIFFRVKGDAVVALGGDFNSLDILDVSTRTGLLPLVTDPTRGKITLDMLMTSKPGLYTVKVITSPIRTDHKAIVATNVGRFTDLSKTRSKIYFRRRSPDQYASLLGSLRSLDLREFQAIADAQEAWNLYISKRLTYLITSIRSDLLQLLPKTRNS